MHIPFLFNAYSITKLISFSSNLVERLSQQFIDWRSWARTEIWEWGGICLGLIKWEPVDIQRKKMSSKWKKDIIRVYIWSCKCKIQKLWSKSEINNGFQIVIWRLNVDFLRCHSVGAMISAVTKSITIIQSCLRICWNLAPK